MSIDHAIENVVKNVKESSLQTIEKNLRAGKGTLVTLSPDTGAICKPRRKLGVFGGYSRVGLGDHYLVTLEKYSQDAEIKIRLSKGSFAYNILIKFNYQLLCPQGNSEKLVQAIYGKSQESLWKKLEMRRKSPEQKIEAVLTYYLEEFESSLGAKRRSLLEDFYAHKSALIRYIKDHIKDLLGLEIELKVKLPEVTKTGATILVSHSWDSMAIRLKDYDYDILVGGITEIKVDTDKSFKAKAVLWDDAKVRKKLDEALKKVLSRTTLKKFLEEYLSSDQSNLVNEINGYIRAGARYISRIALKPEKKLSRLLNPTSRARDLVHSISDLSGKHRIEMQLFYKALPLKGKAAEVIQKIYRPDPDEYIKEFIRRSINIYQKQLEEEKEDFIIDFYQLKDEMVKYIIDEGNKTLGLEMQLKVELKGNEYIEPSKIILSNSGILVGDYNQEVLVEIEAHLEVDPKNEIRAQASTLNRDLEQKLFLKLLQKAVYHFSIDSILRRSSETSSLLRDKINESLGIYGRRLAILMVKPQKDFGFHDNWEVGNHKTPVRVAGRQDQVVVTSRLLVRLKDLSKYLLDPQPNFDKWLRTVIDKNVKEVLYDKSYVDMLIYSGDYEALIKDKIEGELRKYGYDVTQHLVVPNLPHQQLKSPFTIGEEKVFEFRTRQQKVSVKLKVILRGEIPDLEQVSRLLNRGFSVAEIKAEILKTATDEVSRYLEKCFPDHFFDYFNQAYHPKDETRSIKEILEDKIRERLLDADKDRTFGLGKNLEITLLPEDTKLMERFADLQMISRDLEVEAFSLEDIDLGRVAKYNLTYSIIGIDRTNWNAFILKARLPIEKQLGEIEKLLGASIRANLQQLTTSDLAFVDEEDKKDLQIEVFDKVQKAVGKLCGILIEIPIFERLVTEEDRKDRNFAIESRENERISAREILNTREERKVAEYKNAVAEVAKLQKMEVEESDEEMIRARANLKLLTENIDSNHRVHSRDRGNRRGTSLKEKRAERKRLEAMEAQQKIEKGTEDASARPQSNQESTKS